ncbi:hypothetical protein TcWFU_009510 [Taenia crassiceps]|uniref:Uncharacterized protein n=1 Tax=Taenia crassiceps TaxID=6207 RepID=A0ABR4QEZ0_9CEST
MFLDSAVPPPSSQLPVHATMWNGEGLVRAPNLTRQIARRVTFKETVIVREPKTVFRRSPVQRCKLYRSSSTSLSSISSRGSSPSFSFTSGHSSSSASSESTTYTSPSSSTATFRSSLDTSSSESDSWGGEFEMLDILKHSASWDVSSKLNYNEFIYITYPFT